MHRPHWHRCLRGNGMERSDETRDAIEAIVHVQLARLEQKALRQRRASQYWHGATVFLLEV